MKLFFNCVAVFVLAMSNLFASDLVLIDFQKSDPSKLQMLGNATLTVKDGVATLVTKQSGGKEHVGPPSGLIVSGNWNLSAFRSIILEVAHGSAQTERIVLKLESRPEEGGKVGEYLNWVSFPPAAKTYPVTAFAPTSIMTFGMQRGPWDVGIRNTLVPGNVSRIFLYTENRDHDIAWTLKRLVAISRTEDTMQPWLSLAPNKVFPFIDIFGQFMFDEWPGKIYSDADLKDHFRAEMNDLKDHPGPKGWNQYGGWSDGPRFDSTGQFYVKKIDGKWWFIDPEGYLYWSHGPERMTAASAETPLDGREHYFAHLPDLKENPNFARFYNSHDSLLRAYYEKKGVKKTYDFSASNLLRKYGMDWRRVFDEMTHIRLRSWGMNTISIISDESVCRLNRTPYTALIELESPVIPDSKGRPFCDPFHPEFKTGLNQQLKAQSGEINNPWCIGFFVDKDLNWGEPSSLALSTLAAPASQPAKIEFMNILKKKYGTIEKLNVAWKSRYADWNSLLHGTAAPDPAAMPDLIIFSDAMIDTYFKTVRDEFKKAAPNKLYLGCRFDSFQKANERAVKTGAKYCDVLSTKAFCFALDGIRLPAGIDKPVILDEFNYAVFDRGMLYHSRMGAGDQKTRGRDYCEYVESALCHPHVVGVHWQQYGEQAFDGGNFQNGLVDVCDTPCAELISGIRKIGYRLYEIRALAHIPR